MLFFCCSDSFFEWLSDGLFSISFFLFLFFQIRLCCFSVCNFCHHHHPSMSCHICTHTFCFFYSYLKYLHLCFLPTFSTATLFALMVRVFFHALFFFLVPFLSRSHSLNLSLSLPFARPLWTCMANKHANIANEQAQNKKFTREITRINILWAIEQHVHPIHSFICEARAIKRRAENERKK